MTDTPEATPYPYAYPPSQHPRKHGPEGYSDYSSYRAWLRDEFSFRCVYCLFREQWGLRTAGWDIDHISPQAINPGLTLIYENLLYVCATCNSIKGSRLVPDPCAMDLAASLEVEPSGVINALNTDGEILIEVLRLNNDDHRRLRVMILRTLEILAAADRSVYRMWMGYPDDLPDLSKLKPNGNSRPDGVNNSFFARHQRGELEDVY